MPVCLVENDDSEVGVVGGNELRPARGKRPIFDCYWNGRLIPYSTIDEYVTVLFMCRLIPYSTIDEYVTVLFMRVLFAPWLAQVFLTWVQSPRHASCGL